MIPSLQHLKFTVPGKPIGKPRMTRADRWKKRKCVEAYWAWKDAAREAAGELPPADTVWSLSWDAYFEPPARQRNSRLGKRHQQKPDRDNIDKAVLDALYPEGDQAISAGVIRKLWGEPSRLCVDIAYYDKKAI